MSPLFIEGFPLLAIGPTFQSPILHPAFGPGYANGITSQFELGAVEIPLNPLIGLVLRLEKVRSRQIDRV
jgi:hypothetical protein